MKFKSYLIVLLAVALALSSCSSAKKFVYLQDMELGLGYPFDTKHEAVIHCNDRLDITVSSKSPELAVPFNAYAGSFQVGTNGIVSDGANMQKQGYRVDNDGNIDFPILGTLHVEGLKVSEVTDLIRQKIIDGKYIKDPLVSLEFLNFKYAVLGAAGPSVYSVDDGRITLLEAIAKAGDIAPNGKVDKVSVIREENGERVMYTHDLRTKDVFNSPCYYLQQNDIIYVEPKKRSNESKGMQYVTTALSFISASSTIIWAVNSFQK
ncbi:MAG: polysaccharide biosynthesis/export family protein [Bacteroidales bacterium]|nr:polysaccharide biosynthesis/export family protein [Bacteroidales bacterium]